MNQLLKVIILPILSWFGLVFIGYGAQSLTQIIEIPIIIVSSCTFYPFGIILIFIIIVAVDYFQKKTNKHALRSLSSYHLGLEWHPAE